MFAPGLEFKHVDLVIGDLALATVCQRIRVAGRMHQFRRLGK